MATAWRAAGSTTPIVSDCKSETTDFHINKLYYSMIKIIRLIMATSFAMVNHCVCAQVIIQEDSVIIEKVIQVIPNNWISDDFGVGVSVDGYFRIINNTSDTIIYNISKLNFVYRYELSEEIYEAGLPYLSSLSVLSDGNYYSEKEELVIPPNNYCAINVPGLLLPKLSNHEVKLLNYSIVDFLPELKLILPSLRAVMFYNENEVASIPLMHCMINESFFYFIQVPSDDE